MIGTRIKTSVSADKLWKESDISSTFVCFGSNFNAFDKHLLTKWFVIVLKNEHESPDYNMLVKSRRCISQPCFTLKSKKKKQTQKYMRVPLPFATVLAAWNKKRCQFLLWIGGKTTQNFFTIMQVHMANTNVTSLVKPECLVLMPMICLTNKSVLSFLIICKMPICSTNAFEQSLLRSHVLGSDCHLCLRSTVKNLPSCQGWVFLVRNILANPLKLFIIFV